MRLTVLFWCRRAVGGALLMLSACAIGQTVREVVLTAGASPYRITEEGEPSIQFGARQVTITDDGAYVPTDPAHTDDKRAGFVTVRVDGQLIGRPSRAEVRWGRRDIGRYHGWVAVSRVRERQTGREALWVARRLQPDSLVAPQFELTVVPTAGPVDTRVWRGWELSTDVRRYQVTHLLVDTEWTAFPLTLTGAVHFPPLLLVFPVGTTLLGAWLVRRPAFLRATV